MSIRKLYKHTLRQTKQNYYSEQINNSDNKTKTTWAIISNITNNHKKNAAFGPKFDADDCNCFFLQKVDGII